MSGAKPPRIVACPVCGKSTAFTAANRWRPFCSERCRMADLGKWLTGSYAVPAEDPPEEPDPGQEEDEAS